MMSAPKETWWILDCISEGKYVKPEDIMLTAFLSIVQHHLLVNAYGISLWASVIAWPSSLTGPALPGMIISQHLEQG